MIRLHPIHWRMTIWTAGALVALLATIGCDDSAATIAREAADRQADQNRQMAELQREVAAGARRLVEEDARAREQAAAAQRDLYEERSRLAEGWNELESERRAIAQSRRTESMLGALLSGGAATLAALLALAVACLTLFGLKQTDDSAEAACELLVRDLTSDCPVLLPPQLSDARQESLMLKQELPNDD